MIILKGAFLDSVKQKQEYLNSNMIILKEMKFLINYTQLTNLNSNMIILKVVTKILTLV